MLSQLCEDALRNRTIEQSLTATKFVSVFKEFGKRLDDSHLEDQYHDGSSTVVYFLMCLRLRDSWLIPHDPEHASTDQICVIFPSAPSIICWASRT